MAKKIFKTLTGAALGFFTGGPAGALAGGTAGLLDSFGKKKSSAAATGPIVMPLADDEAVARAKRLSIAQQLARGGRSSTILSDQQTLGG